MLWIRSHIKFAVNSGQLSSMNALQVECQKRHGRANGISDKQIFFCEDSPAGSLPTDGISKFFPASSALVLSHKEQASIHLLRYVLMRCQRRNLPFSDQMLLSVLEIWQWRSPILLQEN